MTKQEQQIKGMKKIIDKTYQKYGLFNTRWFSEDLYSAGYQKTIWHSVADGDLPMDGQTILTINTNGYYEVLYYNTDKGFWTYDDYGHGVRLDNIVAWTELPEYKTEKR